MVANTLHRSWAALGRNNQATREKVRNEICFALKNSILEEKSIEVIENHVTPNNVVDIYLPTKRTVIMCSQGGGVESVNVPKHLQHCVKSVANHEWDLLGRPSSGLPWIGVLTNGFHVSAWEWSNQFQHVVPFPALGSHWDSISTALKALKKIAIRESDGKPWVPDSPSMLFREHLTELSDLYEDFPKAMERDTQMALWEDLLKGSGVSFPTEEKHDLYCQHIFLTAIARTVVNVLKRNPISELPLSDSFAAWMCKFSGGKRWQERIHDTVNAWDWRLRDTDVLREIYMATVSKGARRMYGEYYTPDWLAEFIVEEQLDQEWLENSTNFALNSDSNQLPRTGVLDPCCGSGTILLYAVRRIGKYLREQYPGISPNEVGDVTTKLVVGIDIHPIAVEMAKATVQRALPGDAINARINQGDSLLLADRERSLTHDFLKLRDGNFVFHDIGINKPLQLSKELILHPDVSLVLKHAVECANSKVDLSSSVLAIFEDQDLRNELSNFYNCMREVISIKGDSVWAWYFLNLIEPRKLAHFKTNRIVSNPPWLRFSKLDELTRKGLVENALRSAGMVPGREMNTSMDLAALVVHDTQHLYLDKNSSASFILPQGAITAKQWHPVRNNGLVDKLLDLGSKHADGRGLSPIPFEGVSECCVSGIATQNGERLVNKALFARHSGKRWFQINSEVERLPPLSAPPHRESYYVQSVRQGATILPAVLVRVNPLNRRMTMHGRVKQGAWSKLDPQTLVDIPTEWMLEFLLPENMEAYRITSKSLAIVPNTNGKLLSSDEASQISKTWFKLEKLYRKFKGMGKRTANTLCENLDFSSKLTKQIPLRLHVYYNTSGQILRAAWGKHLISHSLYRIPVSDEREGAYLAGILSAQCMEKCYRIFRTSNRHFVKTPLERVPIPKFDPTNDYHQIISEASLMLSRDPTNTDALCEINDAVEVLLPDYVWLEKKWKNQ